MTSTMTTCTSWRNHVTLMCPSYPEMLKIVVRLDTDQADWKDLEGKTAAWMTAMIQTMAPFMIEDELEGMIERLVGCLYIEAMRAGDAYHRSTRSLFGQPAKSEAEHQSSLAALIAGSFRVAFEAAHKTGTMCLRPMSETTVNPIHARPVTEAADAPTMQSG
ncbi:hypothetical protein [Acidiphilium sp.]|uniref:hypothetical protein n=1 Tax=Acidiphilium sp. TaxID=527 RepID=UPI003CFD942B